MTDDQTNKPPKDDANSIGDLREQLYKREESGELKRRVKQLSTPEEIRARKAPAGASVQPQLVDILQAKSSRRRKIFIWGGVALAVVVAFVGAVALTAWYRAGRQVTQDQIGLTIEAPQQFTAGEEITYTVHYENTSRVKWENVEVLFDPPAGFTYGDSTPSSTQSGRQRLFALGALESGQAGTAVVKGHLIGERDQSALARAEVSLSPENFVKSRLKKSTTFNTEIAAVPLDVSVEASNKAGSGERVTAKVRVRNTSDTPIAGGLLRISPGIGLQLAPEDKEFSSGYSVIDSWWELPTLQPLDEVERTVVLVVSGSPGEKRTLTVEGIIRQDDTLFVQRRVDHVLSVSASELSVVQTFNNTQETLPVVAGEDVSAVVEYKNVGTTGLKNVVISVKFEGGGFDASKLDLKSGGAYDPTTNTITWTTASVPALAAVLPGQGGRLEYKFAILPTESFPADDNGKNQALVATATIDSPDLPKPAGQERKVISNRFSMPVNTDITLDTTAFYDDGRLGLPSSGPIPPKVGEETTYTVRFRMGSTLNDAGEAKLTAVLPDGVRYTGNVFKTEGEVDFNERTGEVTWVVPQIVGMAGRTSPAPELHVQVAITPGENLRGEVVPLVQSAKAEAQDLFTDQTVNIDVDSHSLPTTETASPQNGKVE